MFVFIPFFAVVNASCFFFNSNDWKPRKKLYFVSWGNVSALRHWEYIFTEYFKCTFSLCVKHNAFLCCTFAYLVLKFTAFHSGSCLLPIYPSVLTTSQWIRVFTLLTVWGCHLFQTKFRGHWNVHFWLGNETTIVWLSYSLQLFDLLL